MDEIFIWFSNHPLVAVILAATGIVVTVYFVRKHFLRIILVIILALVGYLLYLNGFFTKERMEKVKSVSFSQVESTAEKGIQDGFRSVKAIDADTVEDKADEMRDATRKEMMPHLTDDAAAAAAAPAGQKRVKPPAAGGKTAAPQQPGKKEVRRKTDRTKKTQSARPKDEEDGN